VNKTPDEFTTGVYVAVMSALLALAILAVGFVAGHAMGYDYGINKLRRQAIANDSATYDANGEFIWREIK